MATGSRRQGRELALKMLYALPGSEGGIGAVITDFWSNFRFQHNILGEALDEVVEPVAEDVRVFTEALARGVCDHLQEIDAVIKKAATNWSLERMARVDLTLLRLATYELLFCPDVPTRVAINEAIEVGKRFGTKETPAFVNGILDRIARSHRTPES